MGRNARGRREARNSEGTKLASVGIYLIQYNTNVELVAEDEFLLRRCQHTGKRATCGAHEVASVLDDLLAV